MRANAHDLMVWLLVTPMGASRRQHARMPNHAGDQGLGDELAALPNFLELFVQIS
jgi:hypothetical protein